VAGELLGGLDVAVDGARLLGELHQALGCYVVFPSPEAHDAVVLWIAATHAQPSWQHTTRLHLTSPVKRCGKSRLLDRAADSWESMVAIADLAGGDWPTRARRAAYVLTEEAEKSDAGASMGVRLLADLRDLFTVKDREGTPVLNANGQRQFYPALFTDTILSCLHAIAEAPWSSYYGRELNARDLASLLSQFGAEPKNIRNGETVLKGYCSADLWDAWQRYV
jgi:hypothetical protein